MRHSENLKLVTNCSFVRGGVLSILFVGGSLSPDCVTTDSQRPHLCLWHHTTEREREESKTQTSVFY